MTLCPLLFSADRRLVAAVASQQPLVAGVVVDWERRGKATRQAGAAQRIGSDTQISGDGEQDLMAVAALASTPVLCRLNRWGPGSVDELETAVGCGATEVLLPMVRTTSEVAAAIEAAAGRVGVGVLVETTGAVAIAAQLGELPLSRAYVGLMDLALDRGTPSIFDAIADGTVERVRAAFHVPFGFAGLTTPGGGRPIPARLLAAELVRLGCDFSFLRRSFVRDSGADPRRGLVAIHRMIRSLESREDDEVERDHADLLGALTRSLATSSSGVGP